MLPRFRMGSAVSYSGRASHAELCAGRHRRKMWTQRSHNPYWKKLHEHIDARTVDNWCDDHDQILKALIRKDPNAAKLAMWQHTENTKIMLFNETSDDFEFNADRYLFAENPVVHLDTAVNSAK